MKLTFIGKPVETNKEPINEGEFLPDFKVLDANGNEFIKDNLNNKPALILTVPDVNSRACSLETKHFNRRADKFENVDFYTVSKNTVEDQKNWCAAKGVKSMNLLSDQDFSFGKATGTYVKDLDALARTVFAVDKEGKIVYREVVGEIGEQPDYRKAEAVAEKLNK